MAAEAQSRIAVLRRAGWLILAAVLCAAQAQAQLTVGDNLKMNLSGSLGYGYSASFGDVSSAHGQNLVGNGTLTGSYYNPGFVSFTVRPYWDRNQANAASQAIAHDNGIDTSASIFSGSSFPVGISYGKTFSNSSEFGLPGVSGLLTHGSGQNFGINWSELLPDMPPVWASFSTSSSSFSALGSDGNNRASSKDFIAGTNYQFHGFNLSGNFNRGSSNYQYSDLLGFNSSGDTTLTSYSIGAQHSLPWNGGLGLSWGHSNYDSNSNGGISGSTNTMTASSSFMPWSRFSFSGQCQYTTNVLAAIGQELLPGTGGVQILGSNSDSHSLTLGGGGTVNIGHGWTANGTINHSAVSFDGTQMARTQYGGTVNYHFANDLFGLVHFNVGLVDTANQQGNAGVAMVGNVGMDHRFGRWEAAADFAYSQDVKTLYGLGVTSNYSYGGTIRRKLNRDTYWSGTVREAHSGFSQEVGSSSASESITSSFIWKQYSVSGSYSQSKGTSVLTTSGVLAPTPAVGLFTTDAMLFNGRSVSVSGSTRLFRRVNLAGNYSKARSTIESSAANTFAQSQVYNAHFEYRLRKMSLVGGFSRVNQNASVVRTGPVVLNSFYLSFSRWFNVF